MSLHARRTSTLETSNLGRAQVSSPHYGRCCLSLTPPLPPAQQLFLASWRNPVAGSWNLEEEARNVLLDRDGDPDGQPRRSAMNDDDRRAAGYKLIGVVDDDVQVQEGSALLTKARDCFLATTPGDQN